MSSEIAESFGKGGLFQIFSSKRGATGFCLWCVLTVGPSSGNFLWVSDEGYLNPYALAHRFPHPLSRWLMVKPKSAEAAWKVGAEASQTGLFDWIFLRTSQPCSASHLRRLQLHSEKTQTRLVLLGKTKLPHWMFKLSLDVWGEEDEKDLVHSKFVVRTRAGRSLSLPDTKGEPLPRQGALS